MRLAEGVVYTSLMTTTRINHTGHNHPNTTAARTACRKATKAIVELPGIPVCAVGNGRQIHNAVLGADDMLIGAKCGAGLTRNGRDSNVRRLADLPAGSVVSCHRCR